MGGEGSRRRARHDDRPPAATAALPFTLLALLSAGLLLAAPAQAILQNTPAPSLCEAPGCSCRRPSVLHCKCSQGQELAVRSVGYDYLPVLLSSVAIEGCFKVTMTSGCLERLDALRSVTLRNITQLELEEKSFSWGSSEIQENYPYPGVNVTVEDSFVARIPSNAFRGTINSINLVRVVVGEIKPFAFSNLAGTEKVELLETELKAVEPQAFKKFITDYFVISEGYIKTMPSHTIIDVQVRKDLRIQNVAIGRVRSIAIRAHGPTAFRVQGCVIDVLDGDAFRVVTQGPVFIEDNYFGDVGIGPFVGVTADPRFVAHSSRQEVVFENNTVQSFADGALLFNTSTLKPTIDRIILHRSCSCQDIDSWTDRLIRYTEHDGPVQGVGKLIWCKVGKSDIVADTFYSKHCTSGSSTLYTLVSLLIAGFLILLCFASLCFCFYRRRLKKYINVPTNSNRHSTYSTGSNHIMVVPDGKTYRETELHVIVERAEPINEFKSPQPVITELNSKD